MARRFIASLTAALTIVVGVLVGPAAAPASAGPCDAGSNPIVCENSKPGNPTTEWQIDGAGSDLIQGFASDISVNVGHSIDFKIRSDATAYDIEIFRLGYYQGNGARRIATIAPSVALPQAQPPCLEDPSTNLYDCGNWAVTASWAVPATAVSGVYVALIGNDAVGWSHITFIVRDDSSHSSLVFQTSDTTWQAYNAFGGSNFYTGTRQLGTGQSRAYKLSYNRPFATRQGVTARDFLFANEYPMLRYLERNGYDVSYIAGVDADRSGALLINHKTFLSTGHDEYWSGRQRANVEAARDAGVNLAFFSGNEVYWKTRYEASIDGTGTDYRTLVSYKETWSNAKIDPSSEWTGTWRDPRFSPPADGGRPENALTGTAYMSNHDDLTMSVQAEEGRQRYWQGTGAAGLTGAATLQLSPHSVGYESDEDLDNGFRPAGLIRLSTTTGPSPEILRDFGSVVTPGTTTHHMTMYKAASGAKVFSAGTIQFAWGLDDMHDGGSDVVPNKDMQQFTMNVLADLGSTPMTPMTGLTVPAPSTDTTAPTVTISNPVAGASIPNGTRVTVSGTASDIGGVVAGVEVSTDGGTTWHPADGRATWSYAYVQSGTGSVSITARATDDSLNTGGSSTVTATTSCPCSIFGAGEPVRSDVGADNPVTLGVRWTSSVDGWVEGVRFWKSAANTGTHTGGLWTATGSLLASGTFTGETASGWQTLTFDTPVRATAGTTYVAGYLAPTGHYAADAWAFATGAFVAPPLSASQSTNVQGNGVFSYGSLRFPNESNQSANYWVDVTFNDRDVRAPKVVNSSPLAGSTSNSPSVAPTATFSEPIAPATLQLSVRTSSGASVAGSTAYDASSLTATFTPSAALAAGTTYTVAAMASDVAGNAMTTPQTWAFSTAPAPTDPTRCPCSLYDETTWPATLSVSENLPVELGMRFVPKIDGVITGMRFFKSVTNVGTHTGTLWGADGTALATATFTNESSQGWQSVSFSSPVSVTANQTYTVSYRSAGQWSATYAAFASAGTDRGPLQVARGAGAYKYGGGFPADSSDSWYGVDPIFTTTAAQAPVVTSVDPASGSTNVPTASSVTVRFSTMVRPGTVAISVSSSAGTTQGTVTQSSDGMSATFTPGTALSEGQRYTLAVSGAQNLGGYAMAAPSSSTFSTAGLCPCTLFSSVATPGVVDAGDANAVNLGVKFQSSIDGTVTGVRFYKAAANTGIHVGGLWTSTGQQLATVVFSNETASGWQVALFDQPVAINAGTTYIAAYNAPTGHYSVTSGQFTSSWTNGPLTAPAGDNGVFSYGAPAAPTSSYRSSNYWVDPIFSAPSAQVDPPATITGLTATTAPREATITWSTDEPATSLVRYGASPDVLDGTAQGVDGTSHSVSLTGLLDGTAYWYRVESRDSVGNVTVSPDSTLAAAKFTTPDTTAPVISAVASSGSGTTATVTWTTNEPSTSVVNYGPTSTALTSMASGAAGTTHTVTLTGLTVNTRYYFQVVSADPSGNTSNSPATGGPLYAYAPTVQPIVQTASTDFSGTGGYRSLTDNGEILSTPALGQEFTGTTLPSGFTVTNLVVGGGVSVSGGQANVSGARYRTSSTYAYPRSVEAKVALSTGQTFGFATSGYNGAYARFAVNSSGNLVTSTYDGWFTSATTTVRTAWTAPTSVFRIEWGSSTVSYYLDGTLVRTDQFMPMSNLAATAYDPTTAGSPLSIDWLRVGPYAASTTYTSAVIDAGASVAWTTLVPTLVLPSGTSATLSVRSGNTATPDATWTTYAAVPNTTWSIARTARYLQYRVVLSTSGSRFVSPAMNDVTISFRVP